MNPMQAMSAAAAQPVAQSVAISAVAAAEPSQYLIFSLGAESFAIDILHIKEIIEYGSLTEVPMMPEAVRGVINLRGAVVPVIDLAALFGRARTQAGRRTCTVIVEAGQAGQRHDVGVVVDAVNEVIEIAAADIEPAPAFGSGLRTDFIAGMGKLNGRFVIILDIERVLNIERLAGVLEAPATLAALAA